MVVDHNADLNFATIKAANGKTCNSGQVCIAPDYIFVHESRLKEFIEGVQEKLK